jgi:hypothetical protein
MDHVGPVFGKQDLGNAPVALRPDAVGKGPYGGNMAMSIAALRRFPFNPDLGVRHGQYAIGEETEVIRRMLESGIVGWWIPDARVQHVVPSSAQNVRTIRRWMAGSGRYIALTLEWGHAGAHNDPIRLCGRIVRSELLYLVSRASAPPEVWIRHVIRSGRDRGRLQVALEQRRARGAK